MELQPLSDASLLGSVFHGNTGSVGAGGLLGSSEVELWNDVWTSQQRCHRGEVGPACDPCGPGTYSDTEGWQTFGECLQCPQGTYVSRTGAETCESCAPGTFSAGTGASSCAACPVGKVQPDERQPACLPCEAGLTQPLPGMTTCALCPPNYFCPADTASPTPCPLGSVSEGQGGSVSSEDCVCAVGYYGSQGNRHAPCIACPYGTYQDNFAMSSCILCPAGTNTSTPAASKPEQCNVPIVPPAPFAQVDVRVQLRLVGTEAETNASAPLLLQAVAAVASVSVDKVLLISITEAFGRVPKQGPRREGVAPLAYLLDESVGSNLLELPGGSRVRERGSSVAGASAGGVGSVGQDPRSNSEVHTRRRTVVGMQVRDRGQSAAVEAIVFAAYCTILLVVRVDAVCMCGRVCVWV